MKEWEEKRIAVLRELQEEEERQKILKSIQERKEDLILEERELYFFENEEKLKLMVEEKQKLKDKIEEMRRNRLAISRAHSEMEGKIPTDIPHRKREGSS